MARRECLKSVARNFLETYTSRYSEHKGYWLFGMCVDKIERENIDLLNSNENSSDIGPMEFARQLAVSKFKGQMEKENLAVAFLRAATLEIEKIQPSRTLEICGHSRMGNDLRFSLTLLSDREKKYQCIKTIFVAPHDAQVEKTSCRKKIAFQWDRYERVTLRLPLRYFYMLLVGCFANVGVLSELWQKVLSVWVAIAIVTPPVMAFVFFQPKDFSDRFVRVSHFIAAIWQIVLTIGLFTCFFMWGKLSRGWPIYPVFAIVGLIPCGLVLVRLARPEPIVQLTATDHKGTETILCWKKKNTNL